MAVRIARVAEADLPALLPLVRSYCDFYGVAPRDDDLLALSRALIADPEHEGVQLLACDGDGACVGFATLYWSWDTLVAARVGLMHDLFVSERARGRGIGRALIDSCREECAVHGAKKLGWQTAHDNARARKLYEGIGARRDEWVDYWLPVDDRREE